MKNLVVHITFYYVQSRLKYLNQVITNLLTIPNIDIFVHTNQQFNCNFENTKLIIHSLENEHPYYLSWKSRQYFKQEINNYQFYMYIEDDIKFNIENFNYYKKYYKLCNQLNYNCGFIRIQYNTQNTKWYYTDIMYHYNFQHININNIDFLINNINPYQGMWILSNEQMKKFINNEALFNFKLLTYTNLPHFIRQNASIGPIIKIFNKSVFRNEKGAYLHHLPNNYVFDKTQPLAKIEFINAVEILK